MILYCRFQLYEKQVFCDYSYSPVTLGLSFYIFLYCTVHCCSVLSLPNVLPIRHFIFKSNASTRFNIVVIIQPAIHKLALLKYEI